MSSIIRVFVNGKALDLPTGAGVVEALLAYEPGLERQVEGGSLYITDGRGIDVEPGSPLVNGAILRVGVRARRGSEGGDADA